MLSGQTIKILLLSIFIAFSFPAVGDEKPQPDTMPLDTSWLKVGVETKADAYASSSEKYSSNLRMKYLRIHASAEIAKGVKLIVLATLQEQLTAQGKLTPLQAIKLQEFVEQAYIRIDMNKITGAPFAILVGKHEMAFGQNENNAPTFDDDILHDLTRIQEVIGVTVQLQKDMLHGVLDSVEISTFSNYPGDFVIGEAGGVAVRLSKTLTDKFQVTASVATRQNPNSNTTESKATLGFVYNNGDGTWKAYAEGLVIKGNIDFPDSHIGITGGTEIQAGPGQVEIEYSYLENFAHEMVIAYKLPIGEYLVLSPEVRERISIDPSKPNDTRILIQLRANIGATDDDIEE